LRANRNRGGHRRRSNKFVINAKDTQRCLHFRANKPFSKSAYVRWAKCRRPQFKKEKSVSRNLACCLLGVPARQHMGAIIKNYCPPGVSLDTPFKQCPHERQVVVTIENFLEAVPRNEFDVVTLLDYFVGHRGLPLMLAQPDFDDYFGVEGFGSVARRTPGSPSSVPPCASGVVLLPPAQSLSFRCTDPVFVFPSRLSYSRLNGRVAMRSSLFRGIIAL
jgi:hypothetical protein